MKEVKIDYSNFDPILKELIEIVKLSGLEVMKIYSRDFKTEIKKDNTYVTEADYKSQELLIEKLKKFNYGMISEESENLENLSDKKRIFIIDPLDGTYDFVNKSGEFSIMLGLIENGVPIIGLVYAPAMDKLYFAQKNKGSYLIHNSKIQKLKVSETCDINSLKIVSGKSHSTTDEKKVAEKIGINNYVSMGSNGIKFGNIAEGKSEVYINLSSGLGEWDLCAPELLITEAGGIVTDKFGEKLVYNKEILTMDKGVIASNKTCYETIKKGVEKYAD